MRLADARLIPAAIAAWIAAILAVKAGEPGRVLVLVEWTVMALPICGIWVLRGHRGRAVGGQIVIVLAAVVAVGTSAGWQQALRESSGLHAAAESQAPVEVVGRVSDGPVARHAPWGTRWQVTLSVRQVTMAHVHQTAIGTLLVEGDDQWSTPAYGDVVKVTGRARMLGDDLLVSARRGPQTISEPSGPTQWANAMRSGLVTAASPLSGQARGLVPGVAVGDTSALSDDLDAAMRATSLTHMTAVSGGHFALIIALIAAGGAVLRFPRPLRAVTTLLGAIGMVLLVHPEPSVIRAAVMAGVGVCGLLLRRASQALAALAASVIVLVTIDPWLAPSYGFVLSVLATAGIVVATRPLSSALVPWIGRVAGRILAVPIAAQVACSPVLILLDPSIALYSVPANLLAAPALAPATVLGVVAAVISPWWPGGAGILAWLAGHCTWWIAHVAQAFAAAPAARLPWPGGAVGASLLAGLLLAAWITGRFWRNAARALHIRVATRASLEPREDAEMLRRLRTPRTAARAGLAAVLVVALVMGAVVIHRRVTAAPSEWVAVACDVGQGDALVLRTGPRAAVVIDVGPAAPPTARCLDRAGIKTIDLLVLTHFHADHVGGLEGAVRHRTVRRALVPATHPTTPEGMSSVALLRRSGTQLIAAQSGMQGSVGRGGEQDSLGRDPAARGPAGQEWAMGWRVLQVGKLPTGRAAGGGDESAENDAGIVLLAETSSWRVVALGDLEEPAQDKLARTLASDPAFWGKGGSVGAGTGEGGSGPGGALGQGSSVEARTTIVKMAHHGSASQSAALAARLAPQVVLVSVGENTYGHPTRTALELYSREGARILRTDQCGDVVLVQRAGRLGVCRC